MKTKLFLNVAVLAGAGLLTGLVNAQTAAPNKIYTNRTAFKLPLRIDDKERAQLREVQLFMKAGTEGQWTFKESAPATQADFTCRVNQDGEYAFTVVTVDKAGAKSPEDVTKEAPGVLVVVDTQLPEIDLQSVPGLSGEGQVLCQVQDANLDPAKVKVEGQNISKTWQVLESIPGQGSVYRVPATAGFSAVRASATDRARNTATRELALSAATVPPAPTVTNSVPQAPEPAIERVATTTVEKVVTPMAPPAPPPALARTTFGPGQQLINGTHASLEYQVEQKKNGGHDKVEVWLTCDEGLSWQRLAADSDRESPIEFDLPGEGVYGLTLVVNNGNSSVAPPKGESPAFLVEVDVTRPVAQVMAIRPMSESPGNYLITWNASDKNLKSEPIDLSFSTSREGPWSPIAKGLKNDGSYRWLLPQGQGPEYFVRMEVADRAGNVTRCDALQPVISDLARPKAKVIGISVAPKLTPPAGN